MRGGYQHIKPQTYQKAPFFHCIRLSSNVGTQKLADVYSILPNRKLFIQETLLGYFHYILLADMHHYLLGFHV